MKAAAKVLYEWLKQEDSLLRALIAFLSSGALFYTAQCHEKTLRAFVKHGSGGNRDFQYVLTAMNSRICSYAAPPDGRKQTPQVVNTLRKLLYLSMK